MRIDGPHQALHKFPKKAPRKNVLNGTKKVSESRAFFQKNPVKITLKWALTPLFLSAFVGAFPLYPAVEYKYNTLPLITASRKELITTPITTKQTEGTETRLIIPAIKVSTVINEGTEQVLDKKEGAWHQTGLIENNFVIAGHRFKYLPPNTQTFYNIDKLKPGDTITLQTKDAITNYTVSELKQVSKSDISILNPSTKPQLTLYTCTDWAMNFRTVVIAYKIS